jgi:hypothetical protein
MIRAVEKVRDRLLRAANTLEQAGLPYAMAGGNTVAAWVSRVDEAAVSGPENPANSAPSALARPTRLPAYNPPVQWANRSKS